MADGPGARIVDRVGVLVIPDTSKFQPALKKYLARVARSTRLEVGVDLDDAGLARQAKSATAVASKGAKVTATGNLEDGFLSQMQRDVSAAMRQLEADVPLTADGGRLRRDARTKVAEIQASMSQMALEVPLDPEASAAAKADLRKEIAELQVLAKAQKIDVPIGIDSSALSGVAKSAGGLGGAGGMGGPMGIAAVLGLAANAAFLLGGALAALPALLASIAGPIGVIALGWDGIAKAAKEAAPGFAALKDSVSARFAEDLAPVFRELGEALPKLIPSFTALAGALSGAFAEIIGELSSPGGIAKVSGIIDNITKAVQTLSPVLGPMVSTFLDFALVGTKAFADNSPQLLQALEQVTAAFQWLVDSGALAMAVTGFTNMVTLATQLFGGLMILTIGLAIAWQWVMDLAHAFVDFLLPNIGAVTGAVVGFAAGIVTQLGSLPALVTPAILSLTSIVAGGVSAAMRLALSAATLGVQLVVTAIGLLPALALGALSSLGSLVSGVISGAFSLGRVAASAGVSLLVAAIGVLPSLVLSALSSLGSSLSGLASRAMSSMASAMSGGVVGVIGAVAGLGASIVAALAGLPGALFSAGANMISSLASGMTSKLSSVASAAASAASKVKGMFPGSPVKEGPLTSWNYGNGTSGAGRRLIADLAKGMDSQRSAVSSAASRVAGVASSAGTATAAGAGGIGGLSKRELRNVLYGATYAGTAQRGQDDLSRTSGTPRGRTRL